MRYKIMLIALLALSNSYAKAQPIKVGQACPDTELKNVINYPASTIRLSDFKAKLILLDFWSTSCTGCIVAFPKLDSLQKKFGPDLQIILVNRQTRDSTLRFFAKRKKIRLPGVPMVTEDSLLSSLFPYNGYPYHIWLDSNRVLRHFTEAWNATPEHIRDFIAGKSLDLVHKGKKETDNTLLWPYLDAKKGKTVLYSSITPCSPSRSLNMMTGLSLNKTTLRYSSTCHSIRELYVRAYSENGRYDFKPKNTVVLEVTDSFRYTTPENANLLDKWRLQHSYTYDLILPASLKDRAFKIMQQDLDRYFNLDAKVEKRKVRCMVLVARGGKEKLLTKGGQPAENFNSSSLVTPLFDSVRYIRNMPFGLLSRRLSWWLEKELSIPFVDETGYTFHIDLEVEAEVLDTFALPELRKALNRYGLDLVEKWLPQDVLVLKERR